MFALLGFDCGEKVRSEVLRESSPRMENGGEQRPPFRLKEKRCLPVSTQVIIVIVIMHRKELSEQERLVHGAHRESRAVEANGGPASGCCPGPRCPKPWDPSSLTPWGQATQSASFAMSHKSHLHESLQRRKPEYYHGSLTVIITAPYLSTDDALRAFALYLTKIA